MLPLAAPKSSQWVIGLVIVGLMACNMAGSSAPNDQLDTPATAVPTTNFSSPTALPTVILAPVEIVSTGERLLRNGDFDSAITFFQQVLASTGTSLDEMGSAQLGLGQCLLVQGDFSGAQTAFDTFLTAYPNHPNAARAYFLRGSAKMGIGDWQGAVNDFETYLTKRPGIVDSYVYERIADSQYAMGEISPALETYDLAINSGRYLVGLLQLREKVAGANRIQRNTDAAIAQYQAILDVAQNSAYRASIEYYVGQTYFEVGRYDEAYSQFSFVFMNYPDSFEAYNSLKELLGAGYEVDQYQRGVVDFNQGQYEVAVEAFLNYWAALKPNDYRPESYLYIVRSYHALGNSSSALTELSVFFSRFGPEIGGVWGDAQMELASIYAEQNDLASAYGVYETLAREHSQLPQAPDALYAAAQLAESSSDLTRAVAYYQELVTLFPSDVRPAQGLFGIAVQTYLNNDFTTAETLFRLASQLPSNERPAASQFWLGKTMIAAGRTNEAESALTNAINLNGGSYYSLRASDLLNGRQPFSPPSQINLYVDANEGRAEAEAWLVQKFALGESAPLADRLPDEIAADARMIRGNELWALGMASEAKDDFESLRRDFQEDALRSYQLAIYYREIGLYASSIRAAASVIRLSGLDELSVPVFIGRLRYPIYFRELIMNNAQQYGLDPLLVFSLIWQESLFEGFAVSSASAQGLMQIWPPTGEDIAKALNWPNYTPADLRRPVVSISFGTWLLRDEMDRFDGDVYAVLSAYNAGTGRAADWQQASRGDPDIFVEVIQLSEPKSYVQRIYEHYQAYSLLYGR